MPVPDPGASFWLCICIHVHGAWSGLGVCPYHGKLTVLSAYSHVLQVSVTGQGQSYFTTTHSPLPWLPRCHPIIAPLQHSS